MRAIAFVCLVAVLGALVGCGQQEVRLTADDAGETVRMHIGDVLVIELEGNPSTGYSWNGVADPEVIVLTGESEFTADSDAIGAGGTVTMTYEAVEAGEADLRLQYSRVWESVQPEETFTVTVIVSE